MVLPFKNEHYFEGEGGGAITLNDLLDVNVTNPQNTQALTFDASDGVFKNEYLVDWTVDQVDVNIHADNIPILNYAPNTLASNGQKGLTEYNFSLARKNKLDGIATGAEVNVQSDFNVTDTNSDAFILNKPTIQDGQFSQNNFTNTLKNKLDGIADAAEVNVQSDFNVTDISSDAFILNKPTIQDGQFSQNNFTDALKTKLDGIEDSADANYDLSAIATNELLSKDSATTVKGSSLQTIETSSPIGILLNFSRYINSLTTTIGGIYNYIENITSNYVKRIVSRWDVITTDATSGLWLIVKSASTKSFVGINTGATIIQDFQVGSTLYVDNTNNRVGINISSPEEDLEIDGSIQIDSANVGRLKFQKSGATPHAEGEIDAETDGTNGGQIEFLTKVDGGSVTEKLRINNVGAIGIGGANYGSSGQVLTSSGSGSAVNWTTIQSGQTYTGGTGVFISPSNVISIGQSVGTSDSPSFNQITTGSAGINQGILNLQDVTNVGTENVAQIKGIKEGTNGGELQIFTKVDGGLLTEKLTISNNGGLGIGGTNYGTSGQVLTSNGNAPPSWTNVGASNLHKLVPNTDNSGTIVSLIANDFTITDTFWYNYIETEYYNGPAHGLGTAPFLGGVLAPNGKVIFCPLNSARIGIYDPITNIYSNGPAHGLGGNAFFSGGVLAPNGDIILIPRNSPNVGIYNPITNSFAFGDAHGQGVSAFFGGVVVANGEIIFCPSKSLNIGIYNPISNTYRDGDTHGKTANGFQGAVLAPDGRVILVPSNTSVVGIYDVSNDNYIDGPSHGQGTGTGAFFGGVLAPNGKIIFVPYNSPRVGIYDPITNTYDPSGALHNRGSAAFYGGVLAPNGNVIFCPYNSTVVGIYDPITNIFSNGPAHGLGGNAYFGGGVLTPNGNMVFVPILTSVVGIYGTNTKPLLNDAFEKNILLPYFNKL